MPSRLRLVSLRVGMCLEVLCGLRVLSMRGCSGLGDAGLSRLPASLTALDASHCRGTPPHTHPRHGFSLDTVSQFQRGGGRCSFREVEA
jgi:hypothetical protein